MNETIYQKPETALGAEQMLKDTALWYFAEALERQRLEDCAEILALARRFRVKPAEIDRIINHFLVSGAVFAGDLNRMAPGGRTRF